MKLKLLISLFGLLIALIIAEIALRYISAKNHNNTEECRKEDKILHHTLVPGSTCRFKSKEWDITYKINSMGLRDDEIGPRQKNEFRILVLGDSFVEGYGVEAKDRFTDILEMELSDQTGRRINVINAGTASYSPILEYKLLQEKLEVINPDLVIVALDMTDFKDEIGYYNFFSDRENKEVDTRKNQTKEYFAVRSDLNKEQAGIQNYKEETNWGKKENLSFSLKMKMLLRKSRFYVLVTNLVKEMRNKPYLADGSPPFIEGDVDTDLFAIARNNLNSSVYETLWKLPKKSLQDIILFSKKKKFKVLFFTYPHGMQLNGDQWGKGRLTRGFVRGQTYSTKALEDFEKVGSELGVPTFNLLDAFRQAAGEKLYFDYDGHWNTNGHKVAALALLPILLATIPK